MTDAEIATLRERNARRVRDGLKPIPIPGEPEVAAAAALPAIAPEPVPQTWPTIEEARRDLRAYHEAMFGPGGIEPPAAPIGEVGDVYDLALARGSMRPVHVEAYRKIHIGRTFGMSFFSFTIKTCARCGSVPESIGSIRGSHSWAHLCSAASLATEGVAT